LPKLRDSRSTLMRSSRSCARASASNVPSRLPSSTQTISQRSPIDSSTPVTRAKNASTPASSLCIGTTIESVGRIFGGSTRTATVIGEIPSPEVPHVAAHRQRRTS